MTPAEVDKAVEAWLPPRVARSISSRWKTRQADPRNPEARDPYIAGWTFKGEFDGADAAKALEVLEALSIGSDAEFCIKQVARLQTLTKWAAAGDQDLALQTAAIAQKLMSYPPDVVRAIETWADHNVFFPSWAELRKQCEERMLKRRCLLEWLRGWLQRQASMAEGAPEAVEDRTSYNELWREHRDELIRAVGEKDWRMWCEDLIPLDPARDERAEEGTYFLAAPSRFWAGQVNRLYAQSLSSVLGRPVEVVSRHWASQALERRRARSEV